MRRTHRHRDGDQGHRRDRSHGRDRGPRRAGRRSAAAAASSRSQQRVARRRLVHQRDLARRAASSAGSGASSVELGAARLAAGQVGLDLGVGRSAGQQPHGGRLAYLLAGHGSTPRSSHAARSARSA